MIATRTYTYKQLKDIERILTNKEYTLSFIFDNLSALRILNYIVCTNKPLNIKHAFQDVLKVNDSIPEDKIIILKGSPKRCK